MKNKTQTRNYAILLLAISLAGFSLILAEPYLTGLAAGGTPGPPGGSPPGGGGGGGGGRTTTTTSGGGGVSVQKVIGIYPQFPAAEDTLKNGDYNLSVKVTYGGSFTTSATVRAISDLFGDVVLEHKGGGVYESSVSIKNKQKGRYGILYKVRDVDAEEGSIFINLNPELKIGTDLNGEYSKGETVELKGTVKDYKDKLQPGTNITINGYSQGLIFEKQISSGSQGEFYDPYSIGYADPPGRWNITIIAKDSHGNLGIFESLTTVKEKGASYYIVNFLSPLIDSQFNRGSVIPLTVEVREKGELLKNATVTLSPIHGGRFALREVDNGIYSIDYHIRYHDSLGKVRLKVDVAKEIKEGALKAGGDSMSVFVLPAEINFDIISPSRDVAYTVSRLKYLFELTYPDGELIKGANVDVDLSNGKKLRLPEVKEGTYSGEYLVSQEDAGALISDVRVDDINGNVGTFKIATYVRERSLIGNKLALFYENVFARFWWAFAVALLLLAVYLIPKLNYKYMTLSLARVKKQQKTTLSMQVEAEKNYYNVGDINKDEFKQIMQGYKKRSLELKEKEKGLKERLREFKHKG